MVKNLPANAGDTRDVNSISGLGRLPGEGNGNPLHDSCLEDPMATVHRIAKESDTTEHIYTLFNLILTVTLPGRYH